MRPTSATPVRRQRQRGFAITYYAIAMVALIAFLVVGIDVGRLAFTASEVQSAADVAATAAALAKVQGSTDPEEQAQFALNANDVEGQVPVVGTVDDTPSGFAALSAASAATISVTPGEWDFVAKTFTPGAWGDPQTNAARAIGVKKVTNFIATAIGSPTSGVRREAIAAVGGSCSGRPVMPIAIGDCYFENFATGDPSDPGRCSDLPQIEMSSDPVDTACFTSLGSNPASGADTTQYLPPTCCQGGNCGDGVSPPLVSIGDNINVINGSVTSVYHIVKDCFDDGLKEWDVPLVKCNKTDTSNPACPDGQTECVKCNQSMEVTGFVHIVISDVVAVPASSAHIAFDSACKVTSVGGGGAGCNNSPSLSLAIVK